MLPSIECLAPAKLNLFLHITGRRDDGYHLLQTVFQFLNYGDLLRFQCRNDGEIHRVSDLEGVPAESDLMVRAARALQAHTGSSLGVDIFIDKRLPMGGGLGGGSSDAATTLLVLNRLWDLQLVEDELAQLGLQLGADVPVFVRGQAAFAEGVGEVLTPVEPVEAWFLVLIPPVSIATAEIFSHKGLTRDSESIRICDLETAQCTNVCQDIACKLYPEVAEHLDWLLEYDPNAKMTGTGACVFASFIDEQSAQQAMKALPSDWKGFVAQGMNTSPAIGCLERE